jgi:DNA-binding NarL/FixJ family response regulator
MTTKKTSRSESVSSKAKALRTLVVDDSPKVLEQVCAHLNTVSGLEIVACARNGADAVALVEKDKPDLVVMDVSMPIMDGIEATRRIKTRPRPPKVVMLTLEDAAIIMERALDAGADGFCNKMSMDEGLVPQIRNLFPGFSLGT